MFKTSVFPDVNSIVRDDDNRGGGELTPIVRYDRLIFLVHCLVFVPALMICLLFLIHLLRKYGYLTRRTESELVDDVGTLSRTFRTYSLLNRWRSKSGDKETDNRSTPLINMKAI